MTRVYTQCGMCGKWDREKDMDYLTGYGLCCGKCKREIFSKDLIEKELNRID